MSYYENKQYVENQFKNWGDIVKREFPVRSKQNNKCVYNIYR